MTPPRARRSDLAELARAHGVRASFTGHDGRRRRVPRETLVHVLRALGAPLERAEDATDALALERAARWRAPLDPVLAAWGGTAPVGELRLPATARRARLSVVGEDGAELDERDLSVEALALSRTETIDGTPFVARRLELAPLPAGYHELRLETAGRHPVRASATVVVAPNGGAAVPRGAGWGVFAPLYALRSRGGWGVGDFGDLARLARWAGGQGAGLLGTLPLDACYLEDPCHDSPYTPVSRLFWNEVFLDLEWAPELAASPAARRLLGEPGFRAALQELRAARHVDYRAVMRLKRAVLDELARAVERSGRAAELEAFLRRRPELSDYARFRAVTDARGATWPSWPERLRGGDLRPGDADPERERCHAYAQWLADEQVRELARRARAAGCGLYLDLPLGVHPDGYDVWRHREDFVPGVSVGSPPDPFSDVGQDWGFPPLHPRAARERGHRHWIAVLRQAFSAARALRVDHVMGLHRLWYVPHGADARDGCYVSYPADELYAVLCLEAARAGAEVVGEDLGVVPAEVRRKMRRHGLRRSHVLQFEIEPGREPPVPDAPRGSLASLGTHDTPTFAGFWSGSDVELRARLGLVEPAEAERQLARRAAVREALARFLHVPAEPRAVLEACLGHLARGPAGWVLVALEDLWLEPEPQNVPGTGPPQPNWRRRSRLALEDLEHDPELARLLSGVHRQRTGGTPCPNASP